MTPVERSKPKLFKEGMDVDIHARIARVAESSGNTVKAVEQFLVDFNIMHNLLSELGSGKSLDDVTRKLTLERANENFEGSSRRTRRRIKSTTRGKKSAE